MGHFPRSLSSHLPVLRIQLTVGGSGQMVSSLWQDVRTLSCDYLMLVARWPLGCLKGTQSKFYTSLCLTVTKCSVIEFKGRVKKNRLNFTMSMMAVRRKCLCIRFSLFTFKSTYSLYSTNVEGTKTHHHYLKFVVYSMLLCGVFIFSNKM